MKYLMHIKSIIHYNTMARRNRKGSKKRFFLRKRRNQIARLLFSGNFKDYKNAFALQSHHQQAVVMSSSSKMTSFGITCPVKVKVFNHLNTINESMLHGRLSVLRQEQGIITNSELLGLLMNDFWKSLHGIKTPIASRRYQFCFKKVFPRKSRLSSFILTLINKVEVSDVSSSMWDPEKSLCCLISKMKDEHNFNDCVLVSTQEQHFTTNSDLFDLLMNDFWKSSHGIKAQIASCCYVFPQ